MRNITNTFENVSNRNITNSILTNSLKATLPLELTDDGLDNIISLKGLNSIGTASQIIRVNSGATALEYHTLEVVDLNSTQTLTNKTLSTGCSYTGNRIDKTYLDATLVDTTSTQTVSNKVLKNTSLNYNSGTNTLIGAINTNTYIDGTLNVNSVSNQGIIRLANDSNHSIYLKKNLVNTDQRMAFYEFGEVEFYTGNGSNIFQPNMVKRFSISHTIINMLVNVSITGTLTTSSSITSATDITAKNIYANKANESGLVEIYKSTVDNGNNNGTAKLKFTIDTISSGNSALTNVCEMGILGNTQVLTLKNPVNDIEIIAQTNINLKKNDNTPINVNFYEGANFTTLVCNNSLTSDNIVKLPTAAGTLALLANIPSSLTANTPLNISNNAISLGGLSNFGSNGQVIIVNTNANGFIYSDFSNLTTNDVRQIIQNHSNISTYTGSGLDSTATTLGNGSGSTPRETNINGKNITLNASTTQTKLQIGGSDKVILNTSLLLSKTKLLVSTTKTSIDSNSIAEFSSSGLSKVLINSEGSSGDCELAFQLLNGTTTHSGHIYFRNSDRHLDLESFEQINFSYKSGSNQLQKYQFSLSTLTLDPTTTMNLKINNSTKLALTSTLSTLSGDTVRMSNGSGYTRLEIQTALTYSVNPLLISSTNTSLNGINAHLEVEKTGAACKFLINSSNNIAQIYLKSGSNFCSLEFTNSGETFFTSGVRIFQFKVYDGTTNNIKLQIDNSVIIAKQALLVSSSATSVDDSNTNFEVNNGGSFTKMLLKTTSTSQGVELAFKNGNTQGQINMTSTNFLDFSGFSGYILNNFTQINYNNANSFLQLTSSVANSKVGLHFYQGTDNYQLYVDFQHNMLVSTVSKIQILGTATSIVDSNLRNIIGKPQTGNFQGIQVGNQSDAMALYFGSGRSIILTGQNDLDSATFNSYNWYISSGSLRFQSDRNLVIYDANNSALFSSNTSTSDRDKKENIVELEIAESVDIVKQLKTYRYNYINDSEKIPQIGFMADETKPLVPECIKTFTKEDKVSNLLFKENIVPHLVNSIQSLLSEVELLKNRISQLELASS